MAIDITVVYGHYLYFNSFAIIGEATPGGIWTFKTMGWIH